MSLNVFRPTHHAPIAIVSTPSIPLQVPVAADTRSEEGRTRKLESATREATDRIHPPTDRPGNKRIRMKQEEGNEEEGDRKKEGGRCCHQHRRRPQRGCTKIYICSAVLYTG